MLARLGAIAANAVGVGASAPATSPVAEPVAAPVRAAVPRRPLSTNYTQQKLRWFLEAHPVTGFARYQGRGAAGDDVMVLVPEHQRDYVWKPKKQMGLIDSLFRGFPIPALMVTEDHRNRYILQDGQQRLETFYRFYTNQFRYEGRLFSDFDEAEQTRFLEYVVPIIDTTGATADEEAEIYDRLNQGMALSHGEKFWNQRTKPLVALTERLLMRDGEGLQPLAKEVFGNYLAGRDPRHNNLANAIGYVAGAAFGQEGISTSYNILCSHLSDPINEAVVRRRLTALFSVYQAADAQQPPKSAAKRKAQWKLGLYSAYILYSILKTENEPDTWDALSDAWVAFLVAMRKTRTREAEQHTELLLKRGMPRSNNITGDRMEQGFENMLDVMLHGVEEAGEELGAAAESVVGIEESDYESEDD